MNNEWTKDSWKNFQTLQQPKYKNNEEYKKTITEIESLPPLVFSGEISNLKNQLSDARKGKRFILHGGDCAERFIDCNAGSITSKIKILLQMSIILTYGAKMPVIKIGRIAGQYAKPRSYDMETVGETEIQVYRGDCINDYAPRAEARAHDPSRLLTAYYKSAATLNFIRALIAGGFADMHHPYNWNLHEIEHSPSWEKYLATIDRITDSISFMESFNGIVKESLGTIDFFTSHEGLHLGYEEAMTRKESDKNRYYNTSAHLIWIGERTRTIDGGHAEYFRGIDNPVGIKVGPYADADEILALIKKLNPTNEDGKIVMIHRMGVDNIEKKLPFLVNRINASGQKIIWCSDPMHGNTKIRNGMKIRNFSDILGEVKTAFRIHRDSGSILSGVHFELTGENVTECVGGSIDNGQSDLLTRYESYCDPRLNYSQSMEMAFLISEYLSKR